MLRELPKNMSSYCGRSYNQDSKINEGSFGLIWRVQDNSGVPCAAKIFEEEEWVPIDDDEEETTMSSTALREISFMQLLTQLQAPHIVKLLDFDFALGDFIAPVAFMPLYEGDLGDAIGDRLLDARERLKVSYDVIRALAFLHSCQPPIAHRDVKPENVLLDGERRAFLTDLSFACFTSDYRAGAPRPRRRTRRKGRAVSSSSSGSAGLHHSGLVGTTTYLAPEVLDRASPHPSADAWALGVLLYELFRNERLDADSDAGAIKLLRKVRAVLDATVLLQRLIRGFLHEDPLRRQSVPDACAQLRQAGLDPRDLPCAPCFEPPKLTVAPVVDELCAKIDARVPDTRLAAELYRRSFPDMAPGLLVAVAAKVHEHRPHSDERMARYFCLEIEDLENAQETLLRGMGGVLLYRSASLEIEDGEDDRKGRTCCYSG